jgi:putative ABC transport system ATP-binding protein
MMEKSPMTNPILVFESVSRRFVMMGGDVIALASVNCIINAGDRIAVMGPSGSGKSTLMALMAQLDTPSSGSITWSGFPIGEAVRPKNIGLSFQTPSLIPALTAVENVEVPLLILGDRMDVREKAIKALEYFELEHLADRLPEELSGGQAQRVAMVRALVTSPLLILADEPTGQLDQVTGQSVIAKLIEKSEQTGAALLIATHDHAVAEKMNTIWHMNHGTLEIGTKMKVAL